MFNTQRRAAAAPNPAPAKPTGVEMLMGKGIEKMLGNTGIGQAIAQVMDLGKKIEESGFVERMAAFAIKLDNLDLGGLYGRIGAIETRLANIERLLTAGSEDTSTIDGCDRSPGDNGAGHSLYEAGRNRDIAAAGAGGE